MRNHRNGFWPGMGSVVLSANALGLVGCWLTRLIPGDMVFPAALLVTGITACELVAMGLLDRVHQGSASERHHPENREVSSPRQSRSHGLPKEMGDFDQVLRLAYSAQGSLVDSGEIRAELLEHAFSTVPYRVFWKDVDSVYRGCNRNFLKDVGAGSIDEVVGKSDFDMPWKSIAHECQDDDREVLASGRPKFQYEVLIDGADVDKRWLLVSKVPIHDQGRTIGVLGSYDDITSRKLAEEERDSLRVYMQNIFDSMPSVLIGVDSRGRVMQWNGAAEKYVGDAGQPARGKPLASAFPVLAQAKPSMLRAVKEHRPWSASRVGVKLDGADVYCDVMVYPLAARGQGVVIRVDDVTDLTVKEDLLRQAQKMESIGQLAGGLAHDFNNALVGVKGGLSLIRIRLAQHRLEQRELLDLLDLAESSVDGATEMVQRLLTLSRKHVVTFSSVDLRDAAANVMKLCANTLPAGIELRTTLHDEPLVIRGNRTQLEQALLNLCINAADAMTVPGLDGNKSNLLHVSAAPVAGDDDRFQRHFPGARAEDYVAVRVRDTGVGIDTVTVTKVFEPFFTTKRESKGTGLGLCMVDGIVKQHEGAVDVVSEPGKGATFTLYFARTLDPCPARESTRAMEGGTGTGCVLVADDHANVRTTLRCMLEDSGYTVVCARDGEEAIELFRQRQTAITAVILDMAMPKRSGKEAFLAIQSIAPNTCVLLMSGCDMENEVTQTLELGARGFLKKPFTFQELIEKLDSVLRDEPPSARGHGPRDDNLIGYSRHVTS